MPCRPKAKRLAKAQEQFRAIITGYIVSNGARPDSFYDYVLDTPAGPLNITVYGDWIASRFDNVALGGAFTGTCGRPCNPYSGKWNFHYTTESLETALADFQYFLDRLLDWKAEAA